MIYQSHTNSSLKKKVKIYFTDPFAKKINIYDPVHDICRILSANYLILSENFDDIVSERKVSFARQTKYYTNLVMHLVILVKYVVFMISARPERLATLGESFHMVSNIHYITRICLSIQMIMIPLIFTLNLFGDQYVAEVFTKVSQLDKSVPFSRVSYRKLSARLWFMNKAIDKIVSIYRWLVFPSALLYCSIVVYMKSEVPYNLLILAINSTLQSIWLTNSIGIALSGATIFYMALSMLKYRFKEVMYLVNVPSKSHIKKALKSYDDLVCDIKFIRPVVNSIIGMIYLSAPFLIGYLFRMGVDPSVNLIGQALALTTFCVASLSNYVIYAMCSSICTMTHLIVKLIYPIQLNNISSTDLTRSTKILLIKLKIDSFISRLNKEFVGFRCLYFIKFTKLSFYKYIIGITSTYLLINKLVKKY